MNACPHLAARLFNTPLMIHPDKLDAIVGGVGARLLGISQPIVAPAADPGLFSTAQGKKAEQRGYRIVSGVAVINISGALVHRSRMEADSSFLLGYNDVAADIEDAIGNAGVHALLLVFDSPGGEVDGAFELAERIYALRGAKPIYAIADSYACSAAYLAASAADEIIITRTGMVGSVGVVMRHVDYSKALSNEGIVITPIFAGKHKIDGNPYGPLPDEVRAKLKNEVDRIFDMFVDAVSLYRGVNAAAIRKTEAETYRGVSAIAARLADRISTTDALIKELSKRISGTHGQTAQTTALTANTGDKSMSGNQETAGSETPAAAIEEAKQEGAKMERERVSSIISHSEAAGRTDVVMQCISLGLSVEQAVAILSATPKTAPDASNSFSRAMQGVGNPGVTATTETDNTEDKMTQQAINAGWEAVFKQIM